MREISVTVGGGVGVVVIKGVKFSKKIKMKKIPEYWLRGMYLHKPEINEFQMKNQKFNR